ncbi:HSF-type DNA-binding [Seminavis robusta]|uniref:HSF-type DNA-binding n=1 Tax=Seminavis robusta TaxID=568900 RepID=A0A9N8F404_9STRA|nr:HSF-type DNA-binding [Seminavis robusta]|eukprot:Sro3787_g351040.1 HSF-type DNA-binding (669) ;mRNA; r:1346-3555
MKRQAEDNPDPRRHNRQAVEVPDNSGRSSGGPGGGPPPAAPQVPFLDFLSQVASSQLQQQQQQHHLLDNNHNNKNDQHGQAAPGVGVAVAGVASAPIEASSQESDGNVSSSSSSNESPVVAVAPAAVVTAASDGMPLSFPAPKNFAERLMNVLESDIDTEAIWWDGETKSVALQPKKLKKGTILHTHFSGNKYSAFLRNFNRWGFRRVPYHNVPNGAVLYKNCLFQKEDPKLVKHMRMDSDVQDVYARQQLFGQRNSDGSTHHIPPMAPLVGPTGSMGVPPPTATSSNGPVPMPQCMPNGNQMQQFFSQFAASNGNNGASNPMGQFMVPPQPANLAAGSNGNGNINPMQPMANAGNNANLAPMMMMNNLQQLMSSFQKQQPAQGQQQPVQGHQQSAQGQQQPAQVQQQQPAQAQQNNSNVAAAAPQVPPPPGNVDLNSMIQNLQNFLNGSVPAPPAPSQATPTNSTAGMAGPALQPQVPPAQNNHQQMPAAPAPATNGTVLPPQQPDANALQEALNTLLTGNNGGIDSGMVSALGSLMSQMQGNQGQPQQQSPQQQQQSTPSQQYGMTSQHPTLPPQPLAIQQPMAPPQEQAPPSQQQPQDTPEQRRDSVLGTILELSAEYMQQPLSQSPHGIAIRTCFELLKVLGKQELELAGSSDTNPSCTRGASL